MNELTYRLNFEKKTQKIIGVLSAVVYFKKNPLFADIDNIKLTYLDNKTVQIYLSNLELEKKFTKDYFSFIAPKNTKISH